MGDEIKYRRWLVGSWCAMDGEGRAEVGWRKFGVDLIVIV